MYCTSQRMYCWLFCKSNQIRFERNVTNKVNIKNVIQSQAVNCLARVFGERIKLLSFGPCAQRYSTILEFCFFIEFCSSWCLKPISRDDGLLSSH